MKSMKSMKRDDIMKMDGIMEKLYVGLDIHEKYITGTAMRKDGEIAFGGNFPNTKEAAQSFFSGIPGPQVKIAIEACGLWRGVYNMLTDLGYTVVMANSYKTHQVVGAKDIDKVNSEALADLLRTGYLPQVYIPTEDVLLLRAKLKGFHESIHESGEIHWVWEYGKVYRDPLYGKEDSTTAFRRYLELKSPICICFRSGRNLTESQIELLVSRLIGYIPSDLQLPEISRSLCERGFARFIEKNLYFQLEERRLWEHQLLKLGLKLSTQY